jgi:[ribosomal protein S5]-alanine N-acetyltransferase
VQPAIERTLTDGVVSLTPITTKHVTPAYVAWLNDPHVNRWLETRWEAQTLDAVRAYVQTALADKRVHLFAIEVEGKHIGNIKLGPVNERHSNADISYFIGERTYWGHGHATRAVKLICDYAFNALKLHRVQAGAYEGNNASKRVLTKAGFSFEGRLRRALKTEHGWADHHVYGRCCEQVAL